MVLERDELEAMLEAIEHGRVIYDDIKKAVRYLRDSPLDEQPLAGRERVVHRAAAVLEPAFARADVRRARIVGAVGEP